MPLEKKPCSSNMGLQSEISLSDLKSLIYPQIFSKNSTGLLGKATSFNVESGCHKGNSMTKSEVSQGEDDIMVQDGTGTEYACP